MKFSEHRVELLHGCMERKRQYLPRLAYPQTNSVIMARLFHALLLILLSIVNSSWLCFCKNSTTTRISSCRDEERESLLKFKQSLSDPLNLLHSWGDKDCCKWKGVGCDAATAHVVKLELLRHFQNETYYYHGDGYIVLPEASLLASGLSPHLLELKYLNHLDLTGINLVNASRIPKFIGSMKQLRYLNLSRLNFQGPVPYELGNLTSLEVLDLKIYETGPFVDDVKWVSNLVALKYLDMSGVHLSRTRNVVEVLSMLPSLSHLALNYCWLNRSHLSHHGPSNSTFLANLQYLDLGENSLGGEVPSALQNMTALMYLDLSWNSFNASLPIWFDSFKSLVHMDLSGNAFENIEGGLSHFIRNKCYLRYLSLAFNNFHGEIDGNYSRTTGFCGASKLEYLSAGGFTLRSNFFHLLGHLKNLRTLVLEDNSFSGPIPNKILGTLTGLRKLTLRYNQFGGTLAPNTFQKLTNLIELDLSYNRLEGVIPEDVFANLSRLRYLDISSNQLEGVIPEDVFANLSQLRQLYINNNQLEGLIPEDVFANLSQLRHLYISNNQLEGVIPEDVFANLSRLRYLDISYNQLEGIISEAHFANLSWLSYLDISNNKKLSIELQSGWVPPFQLFEIRMASCSFGAHFPKWIQTQREALMLDLSNASVSGDLTEMLGTNSTKWEYLDLSHNMITGTIQKTPPSIRELDLSHNMITGTIPKLPPSIQYLDLSYNLITGMIWNIVSPEMQLIQLFDVSHNQISGVIPVDAKEILTFAGYALLLNDNHFSGSIPTSLCYLGYVHQLDLSGNHLSGTIPDCWDHSSSLSVINLSSNILSGNIPTSLGNQHGLVSLHLNNNSLHGEIPDSLSSLQYLNFLDLGENNLSGDVPEWIGQNLQRLRALRLRENHLTGSLPPEICFLSRLQILDLGANNLGGEIPYCLGKLNGMTASWNGSAASWNGSAASWNGSAASWNDSEVNWDPEKMVEVTKGLELEYTNNLRLVVSLDLSSNKFVGSIPKDLMLLTGLVNMNLSHNLLSGNISKKIGDMKILESLDLSNNQLSGSIPPSISTLTLMSHLNLSNNKLQGRIPRSNQLDTLDDSKHSIYAGNQLLCGEPLPKKCPGDEKPVPSPREEDHDVSEKLMFYIAVMLGFATGFWGVVATLLLNGTWRAAYFKFAEDTMESVYVAVKVKVTKIKRRMRRA